MHPQLDWLNCFCPASASGDPVFILGHAAWGINHRLDASLTSGVISKIVRQDNQPVLIQVWSITFTTTGAASFRLNCQTVIDPNIFVVNMQVEMYSGRRLYFSLCQLRTSIQKHSVSFRLTISVVFIF
jgi:hypothetical protein